MRTAALQSYNFPYRRTPGSIDSHDVFTGVGGEAGGDVEEPVSDGFGFGVGEGPGEADQLGQASRTVAVMEAASQAWFRT